MAHQCTQETRICNLENTNRDMSRELQALIKKLDLLIEILIKVGYLIGSCLLTALTYLVVYWVKGG